MRKLIQFKNRSGRAALGLTLGLTLGALSACDSLLEVELPHLLTDAALESEDTALTQVNSAIALYECGFSGFAWISPGSEGVLEAIAGLGATAAVYRDDPVTGGCDGDAIDQSWFDQVMGARAMLSREDGRGVYDRIQNEWNLPGNKGDELSAIAAIYLAASISHMGQFICEFTFDGGSAITPPEVMDIAETWIGAALGHITASGLGEMPFNISDGPNGARNMALALRAQIRWAKADATATGHSSPANLAAAAADAATVLNSNPTFTAWVTRESGNTRRNKIHHTAQVTVPSTMYDRINFWNPELRRVNPATGVQWTDPIIFTGYIDLAVMPDGRTVSEDGDPITLATAGSVADTRVRHKTGPGTGAGDFTIPIRYVSDADDMPLVAWRELRLIQAENENVLGNRQAAIDFVNMVRAGTGTPVGGMPQVTYIDGTATFKQVRYLIHEERRRAFFLEGARYWSVKIQNTDISWFPRLQGQTPGNANYNLRGGVRLTFAFNEYTLNPNFLRVDKRGSGCVDRQRPVVADL